MSSCGPSSLCSPVLLFSSVKQGDWVVKRGKRGWLAGTLASLLGLIQDTFCVVCVFYSTTDIPECSCFGITSSRRANGERFHDPRTSFFAAVGCCRSTCSVNIRRAIRFTCDTRTLDDPQGNARCLSAHSLEELALDFHPSSNCYLFYNNHNILNARQVVFSSLMDNGQPRAPSKGNTVKAANAKAVEKRLKLEEDAKNTNKQREVLFKVSHGLLIAFFSLLLCVQHVRLTLPSANQQIVSCMSLVSTFSSAVSCSLG